MKTPDFRYVMDFCKALTGRPVVSVSTGRTLNASGRFNAPAQARLLANLASDGRAVQNHAALNVLTQKARKPAQFSSQLPASFRTSGIRI